MNPEIISVGTELLLGKITATHATFQAREPAALGI
jgi:molybdopterin-biosynthesis enzyme MoeA-like protein